MAFLSSSEMLRIADAVSKAIFQAFQANSEEPQLVANLVWQLPHHINQIQFQGPSKVSAGGVFVHARPFVTCNSFPEKEPESVEIGDLLLIRTLVEKEVVVERRALLLQAKKVKGIPAKLDHQNQWHLYERWPQFTYAARSGALKGKTRHITEPDMYDAAKYLLIEADPAACHWHPMCCVDWPIHLLGYWPHLCRHHTAQPTKPEISRYRCFAGELLEFLAGNAGKIFVDPPTGADGWDQVIHDLITETVNAKTIFMGRAAEKGTKADRGNGVLFMSQPAATQQGLNKHFLVVDGEAKGNDNEPPNLPNEWDKDSDGGGISIIEVIVEQGES